MQRMNLVFVLLGLILIYHPCTIAQDTQELLIMDIEDILDMDITAFSVRGLTQRETPGVMTIISSEEITHSGARDLTDILRLVPGFELGVDIQNAVSVGIRGIWAQEGKVLLMVDGMEMNEILYSCLALGNHFPVDQIHQIEIIRGPGTSFYGTNAELAVINIITKKAVTLNGIEATSRYGLSSKFAERRSLSVNFGKKVGEIKIKTLAYIANSQRSDRAYTDIYGNRYSMKNASGIRPMFCVAGVEYRGLKTDVLIDRYIYEQRDALDEILPVNVDVSFNTISARLRYDADVGKGMTLTPAFFYLRQEPWKSADESAKEIDFYYHEIAERFKPSLVLKGTMADNFQMIAGTEFLFDQARVSDETPEYQYFSDDKTSIHNSQFAVYAQAFYTHGQTVPSVGIRYARHDVSGDDFLPWIGVSHSQGPWTFKALFGQTFRAPSLENLDINHALKPEKTTTGEIEVGYEIMDNWICLLDAYRTHIKGPIVYYFDPETDEELYGNYGSMGSEGIEFESRFRWKSGYMNLSFSCYRPIETFDSYSVENHSQVFLGLPACKVSLNGSIPIKRDLYFSPSLIWTSEKYGYVSLDADENYVLKTFNPAVMANLYIHHRRLFGSSFEAGIGLYNILDVKNPIIQPYDSGHAPLPILSREVLVHLRYAWKWQ